MSETLNTELTQNQYYYTVEELQQKVKDLQKRVLAESFKVEEESCFNPVQIKPELIQKENTEFQISKEPIQLFWHPEVTIGITTLLASFSKIEREANTLVLNVNMFETESLDKYINESISLLKKLPTNCQNIVFLIDENNNINYIKQTISLLNKWVTHQNTSVRFFLLCSQIFKDIYQPKFKLESTKEANNQIDTDQIPDGIEKTWNTAGFTEKAILITTCFMPGLNLHQFRQVVSLVLKQKDNQEEKEKSDKKLLGNYASKWEKQYDQLLKNCQLSSYKRFGKPAGIDFASKAYRKAFIQYIEDEYPIFLQEYFEILLQAVYPELCFSDHQILVACIAMYGRIADSHNDYQENPKPVKLFNYLLHKQSVNNIKTELAALSVAEMLLHESLKNPAHVFTKSFLEEEDEENLFLFFEYLESFSTGQTLFFSLPYLKQLIESNNEQISKQAFDFLIGICFEHNFLSDKVFTLISTWNFSITLNSELSQNLQVNFYQLFTLEFLLHSFQNSQSLVLDDTLPNLKLITTPLFVAKNDTLFLQELINVIVQLKLPMFESEEHSFGLQAFIFTEILSFFYSFNKKFTETKFPDQVNKLLILIKSHPVFGSKLKKKELIRSWQYAMQDYLIVASETSHGDLPKLKAIYLKRKMIMSLMNKFRNL
ncbi:hypothetical protein [Chondrinema litorale]|uniref:hypothetical protein n=1 Tax=Chondrinema litorale TaxID=2994555 RepID=UPI002543B9FF|nr:hypothetical protein [Chondrinema litorale]UZR93723.1 hypothetical protein OQ292_17900 [Chondrinema litorale]